MSVALIGNGICLDIYPPYLPLYLSPYPPYRAFKHLINRVKRGMESTGAFYVYVSPKDSLKTETFIYALFQHEPS